MTIEDTGFDALNNAVLAAVVRQAEKYHDDWVNPVEHQEALNRATDEVKKVLKKIS